MAAAATDLLQEVAIATATTLDAPGYTIGDTSVTVASTSNMPTATGITFAMDVIDANGEQVAGSYNEYVGTVATGTSITNVSHQNGTNRNYSAGATSRVYIPVSAERENRIVEWGLVHGNQDGTLKTNVALTTNAATLTSPKVITGINDTNNNELFKVTATGSAVNEFTVANAATGNGPTLSVTGNDSNIDMNFETKGTGKLKGVVNNLYNPYKFRVYRNAAQSIGATTTAKIGFDTEVFDTGSNFDSATNYRFTAPIDGFYQINATVSMTVDGGNLYEIFLYKNGASIARGGATITGTGTASQAWVLTDLVQLTATDYLEIYFRNGSAGSKSIAVGSTNTYFSGYLVSAT